VAGRIATEQRQDNTAGDERTSRLWRGKYGHGIAAGERGVNWGIWGSANYSDFEGSPVFGTAITRFEGDTKTGLIGADVTFADMFTVGVALGYATSDTDTAFNGGNIESDGVTLAPYGLIVINDNVSIDASVGFSSLENEQSRLDPTDSTPAVPVFLRGTFDSSRWFISTNLNGNLVRGRWAFGAQLGLLKTAETQDAYAESGGSSARTIRERGLSLSEGHLSLDAGYALGAFEPFGRIGYYKEFSRNDGQNVGGLPGGNVRTAFDDDAWRLAAGVRYFGQRFSGALEIESEQGRTDFENTTVLLSVRGNF
jgi:hypothetical protein